MEQIPFPDKKYQIIYADPPWDYGNTKNHNGEFWGMADKHYPVMKFKDICDLPIASITDEDCYLFLWTTSPFLEKSFEVMKLWGFVFTFAGLSAVGSFPKLYKDSFKIK